MLLFRPRPRARAGARELQEGRERATDVAVAPPDEQRLDLRLGRRQRVAGDGVAVPDRGEQVVRQQWSRRGRRRRSSRIASSVPNSSRRTATTPRRAQDLLQALALEQPARSTMILTSVWPSSWSRLVTPGAVRSASSSRKTTSLGEFRVAHRAADEGAFTRLLQDLLDQLAGGAGAQRQIDQGMGRDIGLEQRRRRSAAVVSSEPMTSGPLGVPSSSTARRASARVPHPRGVGQQALPGGGQRDAAAVAPEQRPSELLLEQSDARGHVRLHRVQLLGRAVHATAPCHRLEHPKLRCVHCHLRCRVQRLAPAFSALIAAAQCAGGGVPNEITDCGRHLSASSR